METSRYAVVFTGELLPTGSHQTTWTELARFLHVERGRLDELRLRAPLTIKQGEDLGKLQALQAGIADCGAQAELCLSDARPALFVLLEGSARGPVPHVYVEDCVERGVWPDTVRVAEVGSQAWRAWRELHPAPAPVVAAAPVAPAAAPYEPITWTGQKPPEAPDLAPADRELPPSLAIHAGFWWRCAALVMDGVLIALFLGLLQGLFMQVVLAHLASLSAGEIGAQMGLLLLVTLLGFVAQWLYFALFESSSLHATPGKLAMGIKVVDGAGHRISFGRATGRWFGKIVSGLILNIGYMMAGWTERKQALHDMMAGTLVVFRAVEPDRPRPTVRPPMPWYGMLANVLLVGAMALVVFGVFASLSLLAGLVSGGFRGGF